MYPPAFFGKKKNQKNLCVISLYFYSVVKSCVADHVIVGCEKCAGVCVLVFHVRFPPFQLEKWMETSLQCIQNLVGELMTHDKAVAFEENANREENLCVFLVVPLDASETKDQKKIVQGELSFSYFHGAINSNRVREGK